MANCVELRLLHFQKENRSIMTDIWLDDRWVKPALVCTFQRPMVFTDVREKNYYQVLDQFVIFLSLVKFIFLIIITEKPLNITFHFVSSPVIYTKTNRCTYAFNPINNTKAKHNFVQRSESFLGISHNF